MAINDLEFKFEDFNLVSSRFAKEKTPRLTTSLEIYRYFLDTNRQISVIAVHGWGANPDYTWKHKITTKEGGKKYVQ